jgi:hypothetical protein
MERRTAHSIRCVASTDSIFSRSIQLLPARRTASSMHRRLVGLTKRSVSRPHDLRSFFCIILHSTLELRTQTPCGSETPTRLAAILGRHPRVLLVAAGHVHRSAQTVFAGISASICPAGEHAVTLEFEPRWPEVFRIEPPAFHLHAWLPGPGFGSVVTHLVPVGEFPGPYTYGYAETPRCKAQFLGKAAALSSVTFSAYIPVCRGNPAMAINGRRNKPIGPGGSTRRLHQSPASTGFGGGEIGSTRA